MFPQPSVKELMSELLDTNLIKQEDIMKLKNDQEGMDPNLIMEMRHNQIKERRLARRREKECSKNNSKCRGEIIGRGTTKTTGTNKLTESIIIDEEIRKCQKRFDIENRKMEKLVFEIKESGKEVKVKRKHLKKKKKRRSLNKCDDQINAIETQLLDHSSNRIGSSVNLVEKGTNSRKDINSLDDDLEKLSKIQLYIEALNDFDHFEEGQLTDIKRNQDEIQLLEKPSEIFKIKEQVATTSKQYDKNDFIQIVNNKSSRETLIRKFELADIRENIIFYSASGKTSREVADNDCNTGEYIVENLTIDRNCYDAKDFTDNTEVGCKYEVLSSIRVNSEHFSDELKQRNVILQEKIIGNFGQKCNYNSQNYFSFDKEKYLASKFVEKWKNYVKRHKNIIELKQDVTVEQEDSRLRNVVETKFDSFINKLQKKLRKKVVKCEENVKGVENQEKVKPEMSLKNSGYGEKFKNRLKAQKEIIEEQRQILKDQKIKIKQLEEKEKFKIQKNIKEKKNESCKINNDKILHKQKNLIKNHVPDFLENMNRRAEERKERWEKLKELKTIKEEEKIKLKLQKEDELKKKEREKKYAALQAEQMDYLKKILEEENRKIEAENLKKAEQKLVALNRSILLPRYMDTWKQIVFQRKQQMEQIRHIHEYSLKAQVIEILKCNNQQSIIQKRELARAFRLSKLQKKYWTIWFKQWTEMMQMRQVAEDYNDFRLTKKALVGLLWNKHDNQRAYDCLMLEAVTYHTKKLLMKGFRSLQTYPKIIYEEREQEKRLRSWEKKVKEIIPDFSIS